MSILFSVMISILFGIIGFLMDCNNIKGNAYYYLLGAIGSIVALGVGCLIK